VGIAAPVTWIVTQLAKRLGLTDARAIAVCVTVTAAVLQAVLVLVEGQEPSADAWSRALLRAATTAILASGLHQWQSKATGSLEESRQADVVARASGE